MGLVGAAFYLAVPFRQDIRLLDQRVYPHLIFTTLALSRPVTIRSKRSPHRSKARLISGSRSHLLWQ